MSGISLVRPLIYTLRTHSTREVGTSAVSLAARARGLTVFEGFQPKGFKYQP